jgi:Spy/CpxP family protein refolding chaperone
VAALAACTGLALAQGPPEGFGQGQGPGFGNEGMGGRGPRADRAERISSALKLSGEQKTQVKKIFEGAAEQSKPLQAQLIENRQALAQLIQSGASDFDQKLQALATAQASATSQLTVIQVKSLAQTWNLLTPEQKKKAEQHPGLFSPGMGGGPMGGPMGERPMRPGGPSSEM